MAGAYGEDADGPIDLLADLARATDPALRAKARRLAVRLLVPPARAGETQRRGSSRLATVAGEGLDLDLDATLERSLEHRPIRAEDLRWRGWRSPARAHRAAGRRVRVGGREAAHHRGDHGRRAGGGPAHRRRARRRSRSGRARWCCATCTPPPPPSAVLDSLLDLRGGSTTDLALGLRTALAQATAARVPHADVLVLTDGAWNEGEDPAPIAGASGAARVHTLVTVDDEEARTSCARLAAAGGGRSVPLHRPRTPRRPCGPCCAERSHRPATARTCASRSVASSARRRGRSGGARRRGGPWGRAPRDAAARGVEHGDGARGPRRRTPAASRAATPKVATRSGGAAQNAAAARRGAARRRRGAGGASARRGEPLAEQGLGGQGHRDAGGGGPVGQAGEQGAGGVVRVGGIEAQPALVEARHEAEAPAVAATSQAAAGVRRQHPTSTWRDGRARTASA